MALDDSVIARYEKFGEHFEILVGPKAAEEYKAGNIKDISEVLEVESIFKDAKKGEKANSEALNKVFETEDAKEIAKKILESGEIQLTTEQRKEMVDRRHQKIIQSICRDAIDPQTSRPHPPSRIENALDQAHFNVDVHKRFEDQLEEAIKAIRPIIPIKFEKMRIAIRVPADYAPKAYQHIHNYDVQKEEWQKDGSLVAVIEIPAGLQDEVFNELNSFTHGEVETRILKETEK